VPRLVVVTVDLERFAELFLDKVPEPKMHHVAEEILSYIHGAAPREQYEKVASEFRTAIGIAPRDPARVIEVARKHGVELPSYDVGYWVKRVKLEYAKDYAKKWWPEHWSVAKQMEQLTEMCRRHGVRYLYRSFNGLPPTTDVIRRIVDAAESDLRRKGVSDVRTFVFVMPDDEADPPEDGEGGIEVRPLRLAGAVAGMALLLLAASRRG